MGLTNEQKEIYDNLSPYHKIVMDYSSIIMKKNFRGHAPKGYTPKWMQDKIDYLQDNGFIVDTKYMDTETIVESDISKATFAQRLKIWDIEI